MSNRVARALAFDVQVGMSSMAGDNWMAGGGSIDLITALYKEGHVTGDQVVCVSSLVNDMQTAHGSSTGLVSQLADKISGGGGASRMFLTSAGDLYAFERMQRTLSSLRLHEREMLAHLITHREKDRGTLSDYGRRKSTYKTPKTTRAVAVGRVGALLESIAEAYGR